MPEYAAPKTANLADTLKNKVPPGEWPKEGSVVEVELLKKLDREAYFDMGRSGTGIVYGLEAQNAKEILKKLEPGQKCLAKIVSLEGHEGYAELSLAEAGKERLWQQAKELEESGELVKVKVNGANAGGLTANLLDLKAFIPTSQLSQTHYPHVEDGNRQAIADELKKYIGEEFTVKVIDVNPRTQKLILSEREVVSENMKELLKDCRVGDAVQGIVTGIADFGAFVRFVDKPGIEGLIHISELDYRAVESPKEILKVNDPVKVKIIDIREGRVLLSLKALKQDPWAEASGLPAAGAEVAGTVYKLNPFGAIVNLANGLQATIHISEFESADEMKKELVPGEPKTFIVNAVKPEERRIVLKRKK